MKSVAEGVRVWAVRRECQGTPYGVHDTLVQWEGMSGVGGGEWCVSGRYIFEAGGQEWSLGGRGR